MKRQIPRILSRSLMPPAVVSSLPLIEILGNQRVLIENHKGVSSYGCCEVAVSTKCGCICICGTGLELAEITSEKLIIKGCIDAVRLLKNGG